MKILGNRVLVVRLAEKLVTPAGIVLRETPHFLRQQHQCVVEAVGSGKHVKNKRTKEICHVPVEFAPGDRVLVDLEVACDVHYLEGNRMIVDADRIVMKW